MVIRLFITVILLLTGFAGFLTLRYFHARRANGINSQPDSAVGSPSLLYFRSENCAPCVAQGRHLEILEDKLGDNISIMKVDVDRERELAQEYGVFTLPTTFLLDSNGKVHQINYGLTTATKFIQQMERME
jgi:thioredoxin 1